MKALFSHSIRIRKINGEFYSGGGLSADVISRYVQYFGHVTLAVRIIESDEKPEKLSRVSIENVEVIDYRRINDLDSFIKQFDAIILRVPSPFSYYLMKSAKKNNIPYMAECVGCAWDAYWNHSFLGKLAAPLMFVLEKIVVKNAAYVLYVSKEFLQRRYPSNGKSISCSDVVLTDINGRIIKKREERIRSLNIRKKLVISTIAPVNVRYKGQQYVIKAIADLIAKGHDFKYRIVGGGDNHYLKKIAKKYGVSEKVTFEGSVSHDKIFEILDETDIYIHPSMTEGLPRALIEAMSRGCPVVGSSTGGIPELIQKEYVFKRKRLSDLKKVLVKAINSDFEKMSRYSFDKAKEFSFDALEQGRSKFYFEYSSECQGNNKTLNT